MSNNKAGQDAFDIGALRAMVNAKIDEFQAHALLVSPEGMEKSREDAHSYLDALFDKAAATFRAMRERQ
jgi:hypothetical protein